MQACHVCGFVCSGIHECQQKNCVCVCVRHAQPTETMVGAWRGEKKTKKTKKRIGP